MKNIFLVFLVLVLLTSCNTTKKVIEEPTKSSNFDKTIVIDDTVTVSNGKLIGTTQSIPKMEEKPEPPAPKVEPINTGTEPQIKPMTLPPIKNISIIHKSFDVLLKANVSAAGNVNYEGFKKNRKKLIEYIKALGENLPSQTWSKDEKLSYWMNAYNAMTIDLILRHWPLESIKDIKKPWEQRYWKLGEKYYKLDEIEHKILRKMGDARIHFGINCASFSCPPLLNEAFTANKVNNQLDTVARKFINDTSRNIISNDRVEISKIFSWFSKDFKTNGSIIDYLNKFSEITINENAKIRYMDYDWSLNK